MGFFSWTTADTNESIMNSYTDECRTVYLLQPGRRPIKEEEYEGYGVFGGVDAYEWLALENAPERCIPGDTRNNRSVGIDLAFNDKNKIKVPLKFSFNPDAKYEKLGESDRCPRQGYFDD